MIGQMWLGHQISQKSAQRYKLPQMRLFAISGICVCFAFMFLGRRQVKPIYSAVTSAISDAPPSYTARYEYLYCRLMPISEKEFGFETYESIQRREAWSSRCKYTSMAYFNPGLWKDQLTVINSRTPRPAICGNDEESWPVVGDAEDHVEYFANRVREASKKIDRWVVLEIVPEVVEGALQVAVEAKQFSPDELEILRQQVRSRVLRQNTRTLALMHGGTTKRVLIFDEPRIKSDVNGEGAMTYISKSLALGLPPHELALLSFEDRACPDQEVAYTLSFTDNANDRFGTDVYRYKFRLPNKACRGDEDAIRFLANAQTPQKQRDDSDENVSCERQPSFEDRGKVERLAIEVVRLLLNVQ